MAKIFRVCIFVILISDIVFNLQVKGNEQETAPQISNVTGIDQQPQHEYTAPTTNTTTNSTTNATMAAQPRAASGSNLANYGDNCDDARECNKIKELVCNENKCSCKINKNDPDARYIWGTTSNKCLLIPTVRNRFSCTDHSQCTESTYGKYSKCNTTTGISNYGVCECYDTIESGKEFILFKNVCYIKKELNQECNRNIECNATIGGEAICSGSENGESTGVCKCAPKYIWDDTYKECLKLGTINTVCKSDFQCEHLEALGQLSRCRPDTKTCHCYDVPGKDENAVGFYGGRCYYSRKQNETCNEVNECIVGYHKDANCLIHPSYTDQKTCQCPKNLTCIGSASMTTANILVITMSLIKFIYFN